MNLTPIKLHHPSLTTFVQNKRLEINGEFKKVDHLLINPLCHLLDTLIQVMWGVGAFITGTILTPLVTFPLRTAGVQTSLKHADWEGSSEAFIDAYVHMMRFFCILGHLFPPEDRDLITKNYDVVEEDLTAKDCLEIIQAKIDEGYTLTPEENNLFSQIFQRSFDLSNSSPPSPRNTPPSTPLNINQKEPQQNPPPHVNFSVPPPPPMPPLTSKKELPPRSISAPSYHRWQNPIQQAPPPTPRIIKKVTLTPKKNLLNEIQNGTKLKKTDGSPRSNTVVNYKKNLGNHLLSFVVVQSLNKRRNAIGDSPKKDESDGESWSDDD